jgi:hypothetical protein
MSRRSLAVTAPSSTREHGPGAKPPPTKALRLIGPAAEHARGRLTAPLGATFVAEADACAVVLGPADVADVVSLARALPDPDALTPGVLVVVLPNVVDPPSLGNRLLAALGRGRSVSRVLRATAMVSRGYVRVAAGVDETTRSNLVWGYASSKSTADG